MRTARLRNVPRGPRGVRGFTLTEVIVATAVVGIGISALMVATKSGTEVNMVGREITQATFLAQELRELTLRLPFSDQDDGDQDNPPGPDGSDPQVFVDDLDDLMGVTYSPPRDASAEVITDMDGWAQTIDLSWRDPSNLAASVALGSSNMIYVDVTISHSGRTVLSTGWLVARRLSE
jgi:prepilin-type N-terminal cleavage/methylation domain-containing protein